MAFSIFCETRERARARARLRWVEKNRIDAFTINITNRWPALVLGRRAEGDACEGFLFYLIVLSDQDSAATSRSSVPSANSKISLLEPKFTRFETIIHKFECMCCVVPWPVVTACVCLLLALFICFYWTVSSSLLPMPALINRNDINSIFREVQNVSGVASDQTRMKIILDNKYSKRNESKRRKTKEKWVNQKPFFFFFFFLCPRVCVN